MENYFTDALLYKDSHEALDKPTEEPYDGNEADFERTSLEEYEDYEINPYIDFSKINVIDVASDINEC